MPLQGRVQIALQKHFHFCSWLLCLDMIAQLQRSTTMSREALTLALQQPGESRTAKPCRVQSCRSEARMHHHWCQQLIKTLLMPQQRSATAELGMQQHGVVKWRGPQEEYRGAGRGLEGAGHACYTRTPGSQHCCCTLPKPAPSLPDFHFSFNQKEASVHHKIS